MAVIPCSPVDALSPLRNEPNAIEFEKTSAGYSWKYRAGGMVLAVSPQYYVTIEEMNRVLEKLKGRIKFAKHIWLTTK